MAPKTVTGTASLSYLLVRSRLVFNPETGSSLEGVILLLMIMIMIMIMMMMMMMMKMKMKMKDDKWQMTNEKWGPSPDRRLVQLLVGSGIKAFRAGWPLFPYWKIPLLEYGWIYEICSNSQGDRKVMCHSFSGILLFYLFWGLLYPVFASSLQKLSFVLGTTALDKPWACSPMPGP